MKQYKNVILNVTLWFIIKKPGVINKRKENMRLLSILFMMLFLMCMPDQQIKSAPGSGYKVTLNVSIDTTYYNVSGQSKEEIENNMNLLGPTIGETKSLSGIKWQFDWRSIIAYSKIMKCDLSEVTLNLKINYVLPKLLSYHSLDPDLQKRWVTFYNGLINYGNEQLDIILRYGNNMARMIEDISTLTCDEFLDDLQDNAMMINDNCQKEIELLSKNSTFTDL